MRVENARYQEHFDRLRRMVAEATSIRQLANDASINDLVSLEWDAQLAEDGTLNVAVSPTPNNAANNVVGGVIAVANTDDTKFLMLGGGVSNPGSDGGTGLLWISSALPDVAVGDQLPALVVGLIEINTYDSSTISLFAGATTLSVTS